MIAGLAMQQGITREEMEAVGPQLGLGNSEIRQIVRDAGLGGAASGGSMVGVLVAVFVVLFLLGGGGVAALLYMQQTGSSSSKKEVTEKTKPDESKKTNETETEKKAEPKIQQEDPLTPIKVKPAPPQKITQAELLNAVKAMQDAFPAHSNDLKPLTYADHNKRQAAWKTLLANSSVFHPKTNYDPWKDLLVSYHALDPSDLNADLIRQELARQLPPNVPAVPKQPEDYTKAYWALNTAVDAAKHTKIPEARQTAMLTLINGALPAPVDANQPTGAMQKASGAALTEWFYAKLIKMAPAEKTRGTTYYNHLSTFTQRYLDAGKHLAYRNQFTDAIATKPVTVKKDPPKTDPPPQQVDPRVERMIQIARGLLEQKPPASGNTKEQLQATVNLVRASMLACSLAQADEKAFDTYVDNSVSLDDFLPKTVKANPVDPFPNPGGFNGNPQPPANFGGGALGGVGLGGGIGGMNPANVNGGFGGVGFRGGVRPGNFGGALGGGGLAGGIGGMNPANVNGGFGGVGFAGGMNPANIGGFNAQPKRPMPPQKGQPKNNRNVKPSDEAMTEHAIRHLKAGKTLQERFQAIVYIAKTSQVRDLGTLQAETLARYILSVSEPKLFQAQAALLGDLSRFPSLSVALADQFEGLSVPPGRMSAFMSNYLGQKVNFQRNTNWEAQAKAMLLKRAIGRNATYPPAAAAEQIFVRLYQVQGERFELQFPKDEKKGSEVVEKIITYVSEQLEAADKAAKKKKQILLTDKQAEFVSKVKDRIAVAHYLAHNEMQKTVLLQRIWGKLLSIQIGLIGPEKAEACRKVLVEMEVAMSQQPDALQQAYQAERHILRLWMLAMTDELQ